MAAVEATSATAVSAISLSDCQTGSEIPSQHPRHGPGVESLETHQPDFGPHEQPQEQAAAAKADLQDGIRQDEDPIRLARIDASSTSSLILPTLGPCHPHP